jgi:prepilin-type N-terminal cleavage/methylation domain-containing protein
MIAFGMLAKYGMPQRADFQDIIKEVLIMMKLFRRNRKGFTLVELVVVIAILGVLAAIAVPRFVNALNDANEATDDANLKALQAAVNLYFLTNSAYPAQLSDLETDYIDAVPTLTDGTAFSYDSSTGVVSK